MSYHCLACGRVVTGRLTIPDVTWHGASEAEMHNGPFEVYDEPLLPLSPASQPTQGTLEMEGE